MRISTAAVTCGAILIAAGIGYQTWYSYNSPSPVAMAAPRALGLGTKPSQPLPVSPKPEVLEKRVVAEAPTASAEVDKPKPAAKSVPVQTIGVVPRISDPTESAPVPGLASASRPQPTDAEDPATTASERPRDVVRVPIGVVTPETAGPRPEVESAAIRPQLEPPPVETSPPSRNKPAPTVKTEKAAPPATTQPSGPAALDPSMTLEGEARKVLERERQRRQAIPVAELALHDHLESVLKDAHYAFNHPDVLYLSRRAQITFTLAPSDREALETLKQQFERPIAGSVYTGKTAYAPVMIATLRGRAFEIEPAGEQVKAVLLNTKGPIEWTWFVEPLEVGKGQILVLELAARIDTAGSTLPIRVNTFVARIDVDVRVWDRVLFEARRMTPIAQALTGLGGFAAFIGFIGTVVRWVRPVLKPGVKPAPEAAKQPVAKAAGGRKPWVPSQLTDESAASAVERMETAGHVFNDPAKIARSREAKRRVLGNPVIPEDD
jgi:hypothetical protein